MTDNLIDRLTADLKPIAPQAMHALFLRHAGVGITVAAAITLLLLGPRHDLALATTTLAFWCKLGYAVSLIAILVRALPALSRPLQAQLPWPAIALPVLGLAGIAALQWSITTPDQREMLAWGTTALVCPWLIVLISLPLLASLLATMRKLAPANPSLAGLAAGLTSGATAVFIYSFHCPEPGVLFIVLWYTLGVLGAGLLGMISGRLWLRW
ncbi:NrsF family protein [Afipia felis]|uniref:Protein of uncharacterized function (DUF1109) n=2 Tax=Afipia felis TaxID=1035 RepID=A0A380W6I9_AFIFE|nr:NrsF family protein [Afipia felis]EKS30926.1 hypothetical protein HMPREF9697_03454 [Afipia felis ATCC 53690]SUU75670.1 Protein of uncharacterised function (DUF1109) [Afipia felis]SUU83737.1 Protein of uncharacterised function (DUF1109) [Afipia felis]